MVGSKVEVETVNGTMIGEVTAIEPCYYNAEGFKYSVRFPKGKWGLIEPKRAKLVK